MSPPYSSGDGLPATRREGKRIQVRVGFEQGLVHVYMLVYICIFNICMYGMANLWYLQFCRCLRPSLYGRESKQLDSMHAWKQRKQARIYYVYRYVCVKAIVMVLCWNVCLYLWLFVCMFVAGAYTVMAVAWVVVGMAIPSTLLGSLKSCRLEPFVPGPHTLTGYYSL